jgi:hypothetical protein
MKQREIHALLAWFTRGCLIVFTILLLLLHLFDPSYDPVRAAMSEYASGRLGFLMVAAFLVFGLGTLALALALFLSGGRTQGAKSAFLLLTTFGISLFFAGLFPTDSPGAEMSVNGIVHSIASLLGLTIVILAMAQWTRQWERMPDLKRFSNVSARLTFLAAVLYLIFLLSGEFSGLVQRVFVMSIMVWQFHATRVVLVT